MRLIGIRDLAIDIKDLGIMDKEIELNRQEGFGNNRQKGIGQIWA